MSSLTEAQELEAWDNYTRGTGVKHRALPHSHRRPSDHSLRRVLMMFGVIAIAATGLNASAVTRDTSPRVVREAVPQRHAEVFMTAPPIEDTNPGALDPERGSQRAGRDTDKRVPPQVPAIEKVISWTLAQQGKRYVFGSAGPNSFDCSGLVMQAFAKVGIQLPHYTGTMVGYGKKVSKTDLRRGDILFPTAGHVVLYLGNGMQVGASSSKGKVVVQKVYGFYAARRLV